MGVLACMLHLLGVKYTCHKLAVNAICVLKADASVINAVSIHTVASTTPLDWWRAVICWTRYGKTGRVRVMCSNYYMSNACMQLAISYCFIAHLTLCYICRSASKCTQYEIITFQYHNTYIGKPWKVKAICCIAQVDHFYLLYRQ